MTLLVADNGHSLTTSASDTKFPGNKNSLKTVAKGVRAIVQGGVIKTLRTNMKNSHKTEKNSQLVQCVWTVCGSWLGVGLVTHLISCNAQYCWVIGGQYHLNKIRARLQLWVWMDIATHNPPVHSLKFLYQWASLPLSSNKYILLFQ